MEPSLVIDPGTFRQLAMIAAMQGLLANPNVTGSISAKVEAAVRFADALLEANTIEAKSE